MHLDLRILHIQVLSKVVWQFEPLQPLSSNRGRLTVGKRDSSTQPSQFWTLVHLQDQNLCFVSINLFFAIICHGLHYASCCFWGKSDNSTLQRHPAMAPTCQLQSARTTLTAAPWSSTLQQHHQPAPERTRHRAAAPFTSILALAAWAGYSTYPPCSTLKHHPCSSTSRLAWQHPQAAPSTVASAHQHARFKAWFKAQTHHSDTSTFKHHPQAAPAAAPWGPPASLQTVHTTLTASSTLHQHLAAAVQRHHHVRSKAHTPLWQQHAQRQQHASTKELHLWHIYQHLKHFGG